MKVSEIHLLQVFCWLVQKVEGGGVDGQLGHLCHWRNGRIRPNAFLSESPPPRNYLPPSSSFSPFHSLPQPPITPQHKTFFSLFSLSDAHERNCLMRHRINVTFACFSSRGFEKDLKDLPKYSSLCGFQHMWLMIRQESAKCDLRLWRVPVTLENAFFERKNTA